MKISKEDLKIMIRYAFMSGITMAGAIDHEFGGNLQEEEFWNEFWNEFKKDYKM